MIYKPSLVLATTPRGVLAAFYKGVLRVGETDLWSYNKFIRGRTGIQIHFLENEYSFKIYFHLFFECVVWYVYVVCVCSACM